MTALVILEAIVIGLLMVLVAGLLRSHADILRRLHALDGDGDDGHGSDDHAGRTTASGLKVGPPRTSVVSPAAITGVRPDGGAATVALTGTRGHVLVAFLSSGCSTCRPFWDVLAGNPPMPASDVRPVIVTKGPHEESPGTIARMAPSTISTVMSSDAWDEFKVPVSPYFVLVDASTGTIVGEGAGGSWDQVRSLLAQSLADMGHGRTTRDRSARTDAGLAAAGIDPGDESLYRDPLEGEDR